MKKKIISILLIMLILFAVGCGKIEKSDNSKSNTKESTVEKKEKITIDNIEAKIKDLGVSVEKSEVYYNMVGASDGFKLNSDDSVIEIYKFDKDSDAYKKAEINQKLFVDEDYSLDAVVKNGHAYIIDKEFPNYSEVVKLLDQLE